MNDKELELIALESIGKEQVLNSKETIFAIDNFEDIKGLEGEEFVKYPGISKNLKNVLKRVLSQAKTRCNCASPRNTKCYINKGIKVELTLDDVCFLWIRDNAEKLEKPSLDRIDSNKNYCVDNCRFIEWEINRIGGIIKYWKNKV